MLFGPSVDEVKHRGSYETEFDDGQTITTLIYVSRVDLEDVNTTTAVANGTITLDQNLDYVEDNAAVEENFYLDAAYTDLEFSRTDTSNWDSYTGVTGAVNADLAFTVTVADEITVFTEWNVEITISDESAVIKVTKENTQWTYELNL